jgi:nucleoside-diphosphate-sugar epimerase
MRRVLVIGGTRFVGVHIVRHLIEAGDRVTICTRGRVIDPFGDAVERLTADRCDPASFGKVVAGREWDIVFDQACYAPDDATVACDTLADRVGRYVLASTQSVYDPGPVLTEERFDPLTFPVRSGTRPEFTYVEGKRLAEAVLYQRDVFPVVAIRWPFLVGTDDYTGRLYWHVQRIRDGLPMGIANPDAIFSFIRSDEAGRFACWMADGELTGPYNACAGCLMPFREILTAAEAAVGRTAVVVPPSDQGDNSGLCIDAGDFYMDAGKAIRAGFTFSDIREWMPQLVRDLAAPGYGVPVPPRRA